MPPFTMNWARACNLFLFLGKQTLEGAIKKILAGFGGNFYCRLKLMFSKKATKIKKSSPSILWLLHTVKLTVKILSIFVAFSENVNFIKRNTFLVNHQTQNTTMKQ